MKRIAGALIGLLLCASPVQAADCAKTFLWDAPSILTDVTRYVLIWSVTPTGPVIGEQLTTGTQLTLTATVPTGSHVVVKSLAADGARSGASNSVAVSCGTVPGPVYVVPSPITGVAVAVVKG